MENREIPKGIVNRESEKKVKSFKTERGSVYTYDSEGKTTRFQTATGEKHERQDITVFVDLNPVETQEYLAAYRLENTGKKIYIIEQQQDGSGNVIRDVSKVKDKDKLLIGIVKDKKVLAKHKAVLEPTIGYLVFDYRHFTKDGETFSERHLGNKVVEINYEE